MSIVPVGRGRGRVRVDTLARTVFRITVISFALGFLSLWSAQLGMPGAVWPMILGFGLGFVMLTGLVVAEVATQIATQRGPVR